MMLCLTLLFWMYGKGWATRKFSWQATERPLALTLSTVNGDKSWRQLDWVRLSNGEEKKVWSCGRQNLPSFVWANKSLLGGLLFVTAKKKQIKIKPSACLMMNSRNVTRMKRVATMMHVFVSCRRWRDAACERRALMEHGRGARRDERPRSSGLPLRCYTSSCDFSHWISFTPSTNFIWDTIYRGKAPLVSLQRRWNADAGCISILYTETWLF